MFFIRFIRGAGKRAAVSLSLVLLTASIASALQVKRVEPLCWWTGMQTKLQLMLHGDNLQACTVRVCEEGLSIKEVHRAESPHYLFLDMEVEKEGRYTIELAQGRKKTRFPYEIFARREGSADREGFTEADVIYLLVPDRFSNGDVSNDRQPGSRQKGDRNNLEDRHGGDIQGIIDRLDYLVDLGVTTIWPTPLLEDKQYYHQYACSDYYRIDPHFGDNALYRQMVAEAHSKGLKVIQDMTPNHCGKEHWWMTDLPFRDWIHDADRFMQSHYALASFSDPHASESDRVRCEKGWFVESMPDMNVDNPFVLHYLSQLAVWWIEYADLDGLRVDTYYHLGRAGSRWTANIRKEYPRMNLVGEVWGNDPAIVAYWLGSTKNKDGFSSHLPMVMDFPLARSIVTGFASDNEAFGGGMKTIYTTIAQDFVYDRPEKSLVVFADNHDIDRLYTMWGKDVKKAKMAMTLIATTRGAPQVYYGTEVLLENDPRGGAHSNRVDFPGGWPGDTLTLFDEEGRSALQREMFDHTRTLLRFRKHTPVAYQGKLMHYTPQKNVYTYFRYDASACVMVVVNASRSPHLVDWSRYEERLEGKTKGRDILEGGTISKGDRVEVAARSSLVVYFQ